MEQQNFNWTTTFDDNGKTMTHHFNERVKIVTDFRNGFISKIVDEKEVERIGFDRCYSLADYANYQQQVASEAEQYGKE